MRATQKKKDDSKSKDEPRIKITPKKRKTKKLYLEFNEDLRNPPPPQKKLSKN